MAKLYIDDFQGVERDVTPCFNEISGPVKRFHHALTRRKTTCCQAILFAIILDILGVNNLIIREVTLKSQFFTNAAPYLYAPRVGVHRRRQGLIFAKANVDNGVDV